MEKEINLNSKNFFFKIIINLQERRNEIKEGGELREQFRSLTCQFSQFLENRLRVLGEHTVLPSTKCTVTKQHLQFHRESSSDLKESGCLLRGDRGR